MESVFTATSRTLRTMADGTVRLIIDFEPNNRTQVMELFGEPGSTLAVTRLTQEAATKSLQAEKPKSEYGYAAQKLHSTGFFYSPAVLKSLGTDKEYIEWVQRQPSACSKQYSEYIDGEGRCIAHHVRKVSGGSGTGIKPPYSCIPLTFQEHSEVHSSSPGKMTQDWQVSALANIQAIWGHARLLAAVGYDSLKEVPPAVINKWATDNELTQYLPDEYRG